MAGFGEELRLERESRGVSLDALCAETKVNVRHFEALERDQFHELPGGVFRRGILRAYLKALQLDEQPWVLRFDASLSESARDRGETPVTDDEAWIEFAENVKRNRVAAGSRQGLRWVGVVGLIVVLCAGVWLLWEFELRRLILR